ncbi:MAG TPA: cation diffusion facilitator family transporter [Fibrobacteria bacterium]|nr:cation diffusion facilitator family transporter [Fibrobacteria bacterium]HOX51766.1 cation diffusion facilitator family transporter [Fibrobacteria bacterium]
MALGEHPGHHHGSGADEAPAGKGLALAGTANLAWAGLQAAAGIALGSAALLSDSVHNLGDAVGLVMAWAAAALAARSSSDRRTWGWHRLEPIAGMANALLVVAGALVVGIGAIWRFAHPVQLEGLWISAWALAGIAVNAASAWWVGGGDGDLNRRGAFLHLVSDAAISAAVVVGGIAVRFTGWTWLDPMLALVISAWLLFHTLPFLRETVEALLDTVPRNQDLAEIQRGLEGLAGVQAIHDLHLWPLGGNRSALAVHLVHRSDADPTRVLQQALDHLHHHHPLLHPTIQLEPPEVESWHGHQVCPGREGFPMDTSTVPGAQKDPDNSSVPKTGA